MTSKTKQKMKSVISSTLGLKRMVDLEVSPIAVSTFGNPHIAAPSKWLLFCEHNTLCFLYDLHELLKSTAVYSSQSTTPDSLIKHVTISALPRGNIT